MFKGLNIYMHKLKCLKEYIAFHRGEICISNHLLPACLISSLTLVEKVKNISVVKVSQHECPQG